MPDGRIATQRRAHVARVPDAAQRHQRVHARLGRAVAVRRRAGTQPGREPIDFRLVDRRPLWSAKQTHVGHRAGPKTFTKPEISPKAKPSDARAVRFSEPRRGYAWSLGSALATSRRTWRTTASPGDRPMSPGSRRARSHVPTTRDARRWSIVNLSIIVLNKCQALMNVCAMVRSVSL
jgi:hypothetical protein